jgi:hypothetical protein
MAVAAVKKIYTLPVVQFGKTRWQHHSLFDKSITVAVLPPKMPELDL